MTNLTRWDPFSDMRITMDRLFDEGFSRPWRVIPRSSEPETTFPVEVSESDEALEVKASLPGVKPAEVEVTIANGVLTIKAAHEEKTEEKKKDYYRREIRYGSFHRALSLPVSIDADKAEARFDNGILLLTLPKAEALRPRRIKVGTGPDVVEGTSN